MKTTIRITNVGKKFFNYELEEVSQNENGDWVRKGKIGVGQINKPIEIKFDEDKKA